MDLTIIETGNGTYIVTESTTGEIAYTASSLAEAEAYVAAIEMGLDQQAAEERAQAVAEEEGNVAPTEQDVINASEDPQLAEQDRLALEQAQAENRAILAQQENVSTSSNAVRSLAGSAKTNTSNMQSAPDWRLRITLAPKSNYLYNAQDPGILAPLKGKGVIFPYTPSISVGYTASYDTQTVTHSNFKMHNYQGSAVENITVTGDFTAQDVSEANYMLAVIHFFKSATKMFYGQDLNPSRGVPPPLLYMSGLGQYQFDNHPCVLTNFTYTLPQDVDYINAYPNGVSTAVNGSSLTAFLGGNGPASAGTGLVRGILNNSSLGRLFGSKLQPGGGGNAPVFPNPPSASNEVTRVPTKINISLTFLPIITRNAISNNFSLKDYANGKLLRGSQNPQNGGGIW